MRRIWIALGLIAVIVSVCFWEHCITTNMYYDVSCGIEKVRENLENEDTSTALSNLCYTYEQWNEYRDSLSMFISHDVLNEAELSITRLLSNIENEDISMAKSETGDFLVIVEGIRDSENVNLKNLL